MNASGAGLKDGSVRLQTLNDSLKSSGGGEESPPRGQADSVLGSVGGTARPFNNRSQTGPAEGDSPIFALLRRENRDSPRERLLPRARQADVRAVIDDFAVVVQLRRPARQ